MSKSKDKKILVGAYLTPAMNEAFKVGRGAANNTDYLRGLIAADCAEKGIDWPGDMAQHGGDRGLRKCPTCDSFRWVSNSPYLYKCVECGYVLDTLID